MADRKKSQKGKATGVTQLLSELPEDEPKNKKKSKRSELEITVSEESKQVT